MSEDKNKKSNPSIYTPEFIPFYPQVKERFDLTNTQTLLYGFIRFYLQTAPSKSFYFSNEQIGRILNKGKSQVSKAFSELELVGIIKLDYENKGNGGKIRYVTLLKEGRAEIPEKVESKKDNIDVASLVEADDYKKIFKCWLDQDIIKHRSLTGRMRRKINGRIREGYSPEELCQAIKNYGEILHGDQYYWNHKWTLEEFLQRGFEKFFRGDIAKENYRKGKFKNGTHKSDNKPRKGKYDKYEKDS